MIKKLLCLSYLKDKWELMTFRRFNRQQGKALLRSAQKVMDGYIQQEKAKGFRLDAVAKTGIYAYHFDYANQAIDRLEALPPEQQVLGSELKGIQVSFEFVQQMAPELEQWEMLRHFQYGTIVHDLSGQPMPAVREAISALYLTSLMGLTYQKFLEQSSPLEKILSHPVYVPQIGPAMVYRKLNNPQLHYYFLQSQFSAENEKE